VAPPHPAATRAEARRIAAAGGLMLSMSFMAHSLESPPRRRLKKR
jgi:hypothetical protein